LKQIGEMTLAELAAFIQTRMQEAGVRVVLSGGTAVSFYSHAKYVSKDLDLINTHFARQRMIEEVMENIGFRAKGRYFTHADTEILVEFPDGPLSVGEEPVKEVRQYQLPTGILHVISSTDCVKDRLCAYFFWGDQQGLAQALMVAQEQKVDLEEIQRWSKVEGKSREFRFFEKKLRGEDSA
jgi:hypothetical protein